MLNTIADLVSARVPDTLEVAVPLGEAVHAVVALAHRAHEAAERVDLVLAGVAAVLVDLGDADLDGAVVLGLDDAVGRAALAGDVPAQKEKSRVSKGLVLSFSSISSSTRVGWAGAGAWAWKRRLSWESLWVFSGGRLQVDKLAAVVLHFDGFWGGGEKGLGGVGGREGADLSSPCLPVLRSRGRRIWRAGSGLCERDPSAPQRPAKPQLGHVQRGVCAGEP